MINLCFFFLVQVTNYPQNAAWDRYTVVPPLGKVKAIAASITQVFAISDNYLLVISKPQFAFEKAISFDDEPHLVGYDNYTNDLWIAGYENIIRLTLPSYSLREYKLPFSVHRFAIDVSKVYMESAVNAGKYAIDKVTGALSSVNFFPENLYWYGATALDDIRAYPFLAPYYYYDNMQFSQIPFREYPITAVYDDGMYLYVGTDHYGLLKYNKTSWQNERIIYGPLDSSIRTVREYDEKVFFLSTAGISYYEAGSQHWQYLRLDNAMTDVVTVDSIIFLASNNQVLRMSGTLEFPVGDFNTNVLALSSDSQNIYVGTQSGLFVVNKHSSRILPFGPDQYAVYCVYPTDEAIYVGGEFSLYKYARNRKEWTTLSNFGIKDIVGIEGNIYALGTNNQIMQFESPTGDSSVPDTGWILLPYFNIYDIDTDDRVLYCATYSGMYYYDPAASSYNVIYNLPRISYDYVYVIDEYILAVSKNSMYLLPLEYRD